MSAAAAAQSPENGLVESPREAAQRLALRPRRARRPLVRLLITRLRKAPIVRLGRLGALAVGLGGTALVVVLRLTDGASAPVEGFVVAASRWAAWIGAGTVALGAANRRAAIDRLDGIEILALARGASRQALAATRVIATSVLAARAVIVPTLMVSIAAIASAGSARAATSRALLAVILALFGVVTGASLGLVSTLSDRLRPNGGRGLFIALVLLPWAALDLIGRGTFSLPGALGAVLSLGLQAIGMGRLS